MSNPNQTFATVDDAYLARIIERVAHRLVYVAPGLGMETAWALADAMSNQQVDVTIILDADADTCRIGYGDAEALQFLSEAAARLQFKLRRQAGLRIGLLVVDDEVVIWSPTARLVEPERDNDQPNAIVLSGPVAQKFETAVGAGSGAGPTPQAEIGRTPLEDHEIKSTIEELRQNPPAPFDLAQKTRVFSTRFQFVEFEIKGAEWIERRVKLSSLLLNADLPEALQDILETQVRPFQAEADVKLAVPHLVLGKRAYHKDGTRMMVPATQAEIMKFWADTRDRYLRHLKGFGWLIQRDQLKDFRDEVEAFEETLRAWVDAFREHVRARQNALIEEIVGAIKARIERSKQPGKYKDTDLNDMVREGLERLRIIEPKVRIVYKNVAWESSRDEEFIAALEAAIPEEDREGWFQEFIAAPERGKGRTV